MIIAKAEYEESSTKRVCCVVFYVGCVARQCKDARSKWLLIWWRLIMKKMLFLGIVVVFSLGSVASAVQWDGGGSDDLWSTAANWDGDTVPANGTDIELGYTAGENIDGDVVHGFLPKQAE